MAEATPAEMQRLIAAEFQRRGWEYDLNVGRAIVSSAVEAGIVNGSQLASSVSPEFLARADATRTDLAEAIDSAIGGFTPRSSPAPSTIVINDHRYSINMAGESAIVNSTLNVGEGAQIAVASDAIRTDVLAAVEVIVRAALVGEWNPEAVGDLARLIDERDDVGFEDVRDVTVQVVEAEQPRQGPVKDFLGKIAISGVGGALGTGISAGLGEILSQLPL